MSLKAQFLLARLEKLRSIGFTSLTGHDGSACP
jgi:hypothetical protein